MKKILFLCSFLCACASDNANVVETTEIIDIPKDDETSDNQLQSVSSSMTNDESVVTKKKSSPDINLETEEVFVNIEMPINEFDCAAMQMAGLYAPEKFQKKQIFHDYAKSIDKAWNKLDSESLSLIEDWSKENITSHIGDPDCVFYPFGGPDIAYVFKFFPHASDYILVGLEPIGNFFEIKKNLEKLETFKLLKTALTSYLGVGYFITSEMSKQLSHRFLRGTLYMIMFQLAKLGFEIQNIENLSIDKDGEIVAREKNMADCVKISCVKKGETTVRHIYYVRMDLSNESSYLDNLLKFTKKSHFTTFIKSASYALHDRSLSKFKNFILSNTDAVLQDDTGVPFADFGDNWKKYAFGTYTEPTLPIFKGYKQKLLVDFYNSNKIVKIPFKIGYGYKQARPNLLMAISLKRVLKDVNELKEKQKYMNECKECNDKTKNAESAK